MTVPYVVANDMPGATLSDKINNALSSASGLNSAPGEVIVVIPPGVSIGTISSTVTVNAQQTLRFAPGVYIQTATIHLAGNGSQLVGSGRFTTYLANTNPAGASVKLGVSGFQNVNTSFQLSDITLTRELQVGQTPAASALGVDATEYLTDAVIRDIQVVGHHLGVSLGQTNHSRFDRANVYTSKTHGVQIVNATPVPGPCQWHLTDILCDSNLGSGFYITSSYYGPGQQLLPIALGTYTNLNTFNNGQRGLIAVAGAQAPIGGVRLIGGLMGTNAEEGIYLDTAGALHSIRDVLIELNVKDGILCTASNRDVSITGCTVSANKLSGISTAAGRTVISGCDVSESNGFGIYTSGQQTLISGCDVTDNGKVGTNKTGIVLVGPSAEVTGCRSGNTNALAKTQDYGVYINSGVKAVVTGTRCDSNAVCGVAISGLATAIVRNNRLDGNGVPIIGTPSTADNLTA